MDLARRIGEGLGTFAKVVTSVLPRSRETAIAMGYAVNEIVTLRTGNDGAYDEVGAFDWESVASPFVGVSHLISANGPYALYAHSLAAQWRDILKTEPVSIAPGTSVVMNS